MTTVPETRYAKSGKLGGIAVHIGARVAGQAAPGEWRLYAFVG
jgi:hypothetical protein